MKPLILFFSMVCGVALAAAAVLQDGVYSGQANGYKGPVSVEVTVADGKVFAVKVTKCRDKFLRRIAKEMPRRIVKANSAEVDVVSGATITSRAVKRAVEQALEKAQ